MRYYFIFFSILFSSSVCAQSQSSYRIIQQEQQRLEEQRRQLESEQRERSRRLSPTQEKSVPTIAEGTCFTINRVSFVGITVFSETKLLTVIDPLLGGCLGIAQLNEMLESVTIHYFNAGYVTTRAYLSQQNLSSGEVIVNVVEGVVESLRDKSSLKDSDTKKALLSDKKLSQLFPIKINEPLNLRDLEQSLEQINRLQSYQAKMELLPGSVMGSSIVDVTQTQSKPWQVQSKFNNSGQVSTGEEQLQLFLGWDNPLGLYDYSYFSYQSDLEKSLDELKSESMAWHWDVPIGYWNVSFDASYFEYQSLVEGDFQIFLTSGTSASQKLSVKKILFRGAISKTRLSWDLTRKRSENYIEAVLLETSTRALAVSALALTHEQYFQSGGFLLLDFGYARGLNKLSSPDDANIVSALRHDTPKAQFDKYTFSIDYSQPFTLAKQKLQYKTRWTGQYSPDVLFGTEQISVGGQYTVRGYKESSVAGNTGTYWRNDLYWQLPLAANQPLFKNLQIQSLTPFIGLDVGLVRDESISTDKYEKLKGWAVGLMARGNHWAVETTYAQPISEPKYLANTGEEFDFSVTMFF